MKPTVALVHGLMRTSRSMARLSRAIEDAGYPTWLGSYPSQRRSIEHNAAAIVDQLRHETRGPLLLVTHSLGGILARYIAGPMGRDAGLDVQGVLMLAPPNGGSRLARRFAPFAAFRRLYGPAGQELGAAVAPAWPLPEVPVAVIAGTVARGLNFTGWVSTVARLIQPDELSDGTVLVEETRLPGMVDFATVAASHTFIMDHPEARTMILRFLSGGRLR